LSRISPSRRAIGPAKGKENDMTVMTGWDLFEDLRTAQDELLRMNRLAAARLGQAGQQHDAGTSAQTWAPAVDITERKDAYLVSADLPGVGIDDIEITFQDGLLTVQGQRHVGHDSSEERVHRAERRYGAFRRSIMLPMHVKADAIEASTQNGVLQILVPKAEEVHAKRIQVRRGSDQAALQAPGNEPRG
jgi:HSP20 family protein